MTVLPDQPDPNLRRLSPADARLVDHLINGEPVDGPIDPAQLARVRDVLGLLERWEAADPDADLSTQTLSGVLALAPVRLSEQDGLALDALLDLRRLGLSQGPMPAGAKARAQRVASVLSLLDQTADEPVPAGLTKRTLAFIEQDRLAQQRMSIASASAGGRWRPAGGSIRQIATTAALLMMVLSVLLPVLDKSRRDAMIAQCEQNLAGLGVDLQQFASDNKGSLKASMPGSRDSEPASPGIFNHLSGFASRQVDGSRVPANSVNLFILLDERSDRGSEHLICPAAKDPGSPTALYNGQNPIAGGPLRVYLQPRPIFADTNPLYRLTANGLVRDTAIPGMTRSKNHDGVGQNVLISDGSVDWKVRPAVLREGAEGEDNIWLLQQPAGGSDEADVFLTP